MAARFGSVAGVTCFVRQLFAISDGGQVLNLDQFNEDVSMAFCEWDQADLMKLWPRDLAA